MCDFLKVLQMAHIHVLWNLAHTIDWLDILCGSSFIKKSYLSWIHPVLHYHVLKSFRLCFNWSCFNISIDSFLEWINAKTLHNYTFPLKKVYQAIMCSLGHVRNNFIIFSTFWQQQLPGTAHLFSRPPYMLIISAIWWTLKCK